MEARHSVWLKTYTFCRTLEHYTGTCKENCPHHEARAVYECKVEEFFLPPELIQKYVA